MEGHLINLDTSVKQFKALFDGRLSAARTAKIDNLNATISSRAAQSTANSILAQTNTIDSRAGNIQSLVNRIYPQTDKIARVPTGGGVLKGAIRRKTGRGAQSVAVATITGSGVLRFVGKPILSRYQNQITCKANIDGRIFDLSSGDDAGHFFAAQGLRFNSYFKIIVNYYHSGDTHVPHQVQVMYGYTLGD